MSVTIPSQVAQAQKIFVSHSGGKDSQAMLAALVAAGLQDKLVIIHSDLGEMEWEHMAPWIEQTSFGMPVNVVKPELAMKTARLERELGKTIRLRSVGGKKVPSYLDERFVTACS